MRKPKKIVTLALLLGLLSSCGNNSQVSASTDTSTDTSVETSSEVVSTATSEEGLSSDEVISSSVEEETKIVPAVTAPEGVTVEGLADEYQPGDLVRFTLKTEEGVRVTSVTVNGLALQEVSGAYSYTLSLSAENLEIVITAVTVAKLTPTIQTNDQQIAVSGLEESYWAGDLVRFKVIARNAQKHLLGAMINNDPVLPDENGFIVYRIPVEATELTIIILTQYNEAVIETNATNAEVTYDKDSYLINDQVTFTVTPNEGCTITSVQANGVELTAAADGSYSFVAQASNTVAVVAQSDLQATFEASEGITQSGIDLEAKYHAGDVINFTLAVPETYDKNTLVVAVNGNALTEEEGSYTYTVAGTDTALAFTANAVIKVLKPTFVAPVDIVQEGLKLEEGYKVGETVSFTLDVPAMYKAGSVVAKINGEAIAADAGTYSYTVKGSDEALAVTVEADLIDITPAITKDAEVTISGVPEVVHPMDEIEFSLEVPAKLTLTGVKVNGEAVEAVEGKYKVTLGKDATALAIVVETVDTKVNATGTITYKGGAFNKNQYDFMSVRLIDSSDHVINAETTVSEGKLNYSAELPKFGDYTLQVLMTGDDELNHEVTASNFTFDAAEVAKSLDITTDVAERTTWVDAEGASWDEVEKGGKGSLTHATPKGVINASDDYMVTFDWSYTGKIRDDSGNFLNDPTYGANSNKNASWSVDPVNSSNKSLTRFEMIAWNGTWYYKHYTRGTDNNYAIQDNLNTFPGIKEYVKQWNTAGGQRFGIGRRTLNGVTFNETYIIDGGNVYVQTHSPVDEGSTGEVTGLYLCDFSNTAAENTQGVESIKNIKWERNPFGENKGRFVYRPSYAERNSGTVFYLNALTCFSDKTDTAVNQTKNSAPYRLADQDFIIKWHVKNPYILNDDGTIREAGSEIGDWTGMAFTGRWYPYGSQTQFTVNFFHFCSKTGTSKKWAFRPTISGVTMADGDLTEDEIKAIGNSQLDIVVQKKGWHFEVYTVLNGVASYKTGGDMDADHQATWTMPYYLDASIAGATDAFKNGARVLIDEVIFSPNANEFLTH